MASSRHWPNELWLTEISEHETQEAKLCGCVMLDMYSRRLSAGPSTGAVKPPRFWAAIAKGRAPTAIAYYIEHFHNPAWRHSSLGGCR